MRSGVILSSALVHGEEEEEEEALGVVIPGGAFPPRAGPAAEERTGRPAADAGGFGRSRKEQQCWGTVRNTVAVVIMREGDMNGSANQNH